LLVAALAASSNG